MSWWRNAQKVYMQQLDLNKKLTGVILFGDSVLFGTGATARNKGCGRILKNFFKDIPVIIKGRNRDTTQDGLQRLKVDVLNEAICSHVIVLFGNNDCRLIDVDTSKISLEEYQNNLIKIIEQIINRNKIPILSNLQPINSELFYKTLPDMVKFVKRIDSPYSWHEKYSLVCNKVAAERNIKLADIRSELKKSESRVISNDGLHPNDLGHEVIAQKFADILMQ